MKKQKENSLENITWSEMGKQNVQAKEVYWHGFQKKKRFGSDKICTVNNLSVPHFIRAEPKFFTRAGTFGEVVRARVKMVRVLRKVARFG